jgi:hypothetical protein
MNLVEGAKRMQLAGRWICTAAALLLVLSLFLSAVLRSFHRGDFFLPTDLATPLLFLVAISSAVLWLTGWILEGFGKDAGQK